VLRIIKSVTNISPAIKRDAGDGFVALRRSPRTIAFIASMSALANVISLYSVPISILGFRSSIHFLQLPIILGAIVAGASVGLIIGFFGAFAMAYFMGMPFILGGMAILGLLSGLFVKKVRPLFAGPLAYLASVPYVAVTDYLWGIPLPVVGIILVNLGMEVVLCSILVDVISKYRATTSFITSMRQEGHPTHQNLIQRLEDESKGLIILKNDREIYSSAESGIAGLLNAMERIGATSLKDSVIVDKVVGKAAALIMTCFAAREVHARIMSVAATSVLQKHSTTFSYLQLVDEIMDRSGLGICKFEKLVSEVEDPKEALDVLKRAQPSPV
jgi:hypothetical protein